MPFTTPPTFTSGAILQASQLNILSDDIAFINSLTDYVNPSGSTYQYGVGGTEWMGNHSGFIRHRNRYLHYYLVLESGSITNTPHVLHLVVDWGGGPRDIWSAGVVLNAPPVQTIAGYVDLQGNDLSSVALNIPLGAILQIRWEANCAGLARNYYFLESDYTSL